MDTITVCMPCENTSLVHQDERLRRNILLGTLLGLGLVAVTALGLSQMGNTAAYARMEVAKIGSVPGSLNAVKLPNQIHRMQDIPLSAASSLKVSQSVHTDNTMRRSVDDELTLGGENQGPSLFTMLALAASFLAGYAMSGLRQQPSKVAMLATTGTTAEADGENDPTKGGLLDLEDLDNEDTGRGSQAVPEGTEKVTGAAQDYGFETNTRQILDIVARSLYHDKEVFIRELISNASDAIEKYRYVKLISDQELEEAAEPSIKLYSDPVKKTFIVQDTGIGMTKDELVNNLGTIASSGSRQLMERLQAAQKDADNLIGQFGVGFYSAFIVAKSVKVFTKSCLKGSKGYMWESDGHGNYSIAEADGVTQGTKIIVELKDEDKEFSEENNLEKIIRKYSNFIGSPIFLNGKRQNTVEALWRKNPKDVTDEQYVEFYKYITNAYDKPTFKLHYRVDAPVDIKAILFTPEYNMEQPGRTRIQANVNLYCKKVLIKAKCPDLLPDWMRFVSGVVDSEDLPLNVSREGTQDSKAFKKLSKLVTSRVLKWLADEADKDKSKYNTFFKEFGYFLKEGSCTDEKNQAALAKLLRFESSKLEAGQLTSFDEYIERFAEGQERIYFLHAPSRQTALSSPYYEQLRKKGVEVLFMYGTLDEYLMNNYPEYKGHKFTSIENSDLGLQSIKSKDEEAQTEEPLTEKQCKRFSKFLTKALADKCSEAKPSDRLVDSPAIIAAGFEQASMFRHLKQIAMLQGKKGLDGPLGMQQIEYNPRHPIIKRMYWLTRSTDAASQQRAKMMAEQIFDNALIASGLMDDPRLMLERLNKLLKDSLNDVELGQDDDEDTPADLEEEPAKKKPKAPEWPTTPADEARMKEMMEKEFANLGEENREKLDQMVADAMMRNTRPADPDMDIDVQDAEFTETKPSQKAPDAAEKK